MDIFVLTLAIFLLAAMGMALGFLVTGVELTGTCAALARAGFNGASCETCPLRNLRKKCMRRKERPIGRGSGRTSTANDRWSSEP